MTKDRKTELFDRAAEIFMRLQDAPQDARALQDKKEFLSQGKDAQRAFGQVSKAWAASGMRKPPKGPANVVSLALLGAAA